MRNGEQVRPRPVIVLSLPASGQMPTTEWFLIWLILQRLFSQSIRFWISLRSIAFLHLRICWWSCVRTRSRLRSGFSIVSKLPIIIRSTAVSRVVVTSGIPQVPARRWLRSRRQDWHRNCLILTRYCLWLTAKIWTTRPWKNMTVLKKVRPTAIPRQPY